jgi:ubiquinone/menaquinone biosynthesis C-methylase UbiE
VTSEFDKYAESYRGEVNRALAFAGKQVDFYAERKAAMLCGLAQGSLGDPADLNILDVGCGIGLADGHLVGSFGSVFGVDTSREEIEQARAEHPAVTYEVSQPARIPYPADHFDVVFAACVLHHVASADQPSLVAEMARVTRPAGIVVVFEHNPWNPLTRLVVKRVSFDHGVELLRPNVVTSLFERVGVHPRRVRNMTFSPWRGALAAELEKALWWLPVGAQYAVIGQKTAG